ncbi:hypothetical protein [Paraburkholderia phenoliruptrix]|uniref:hypothetical protein n=1 Tax=Paraburkholderia phenoliruptrix TaxID=252970 RepID=UPI003D988004
MDKHHRIRPERPSVQEVLALDSTVRIMRRVQGKKNPEDVPIGSPEWEAVSLEVMRDLCRAMGDDPDELRRLDL